MTKKSMLPPHFSAEVENKISGLLFRAIEMDGADMGNIQLFHPQEGILTIVSQNGFDQLFLEYFKSVKAFDSSACGRAIGIGSTVLISDVNIDLGFVPHRSIARSAGFRAVKSIPLSNKNNNFVGVLSTHFKNPKWDWETKKLIPLAEEIAEILSDSISGKQA